MRLLPILALGLLLGLAPKGYGQTVTLSAPSSSSTNVNTVTTLFTISEPTGTPQQIQVVFTYTSGPDTASIGSTWTLTMKANTPAPGSFTVQPTAMGAVSNPYTATTTSPTGLAAGNAMSEGYYSVYCQYIRPAAAGGTLLRSTTRTSVYIDTVTETPSFQPAMSASIATSTGVVTLAGHNLANNAPVTVSGTSVSSTTTYYVSVIDANTFYLSTIPNGTSANYVTFATATAPVIHYPPFISSNQVFNGTTVALGYNLPELYLSGSASLTFTGPTTETLTLADNLLNAQFTLNRTAVVTSSVITAASAAMIPDGVYSVTLSYRDRFGHNPATAVASNVTFDSVTEPPAFTTFTNGSSIVNGTAIAYTLGEPALPGSVQLIFDNGVTTPTTVALGNAVSGTFTYNRALYATSIPTGTYTVTLSYQDAAGNAAATAVATGVTVTAPPISNTDDTDGDGLNDAAEVLLAPLGFDWQVSQPGMVQTFLTNAGLFTQAQMNANRVAGQADVTSSPATYGLTTTSASAAAVAASRLAGQADVTGSPGTYGLYSLSQVQDLYVNTPILTQDITTGNWKLRVGIQTSSDLINFTPFPFIQGGTTINSSGEVEFEFTVPSGQAFFRLHAH